MFRLLKWIGMVGLIASVVYIVVNLPSDILEIRGDLLKSPSTSAAVSLVGVCGVLVFSTVLVLGMSGERGLGLHPGVFLVIVALLGLTQLYCYRSFHGWLDHKARYLVTAWTKERLEVAPFRGVIHAFGMRSPDDPYDPREGNKSLGEAFGDLVLGLFIVLPIMLVVAIFWLPIWIATFFALWAFLGATHIHFLPSFVIPFLAHDIVYPLVFRIAVATSRHPVEAVLSARPSGTELPARLDTRSIAQQMYKASEGVPFSWGSMVKGARVKWLRERVEAETQFMRSVREHTKERARHDG